MIFKRMGKVNVGSKRLTLEDEALFVDHARLPAYNLRTYCPKINIVKEDFTFTRSIESLD